MKKIALIQGHPDPAGGHFLHALAKAYAASAIEAGHVVKAIAVAQLDAPLVRSKQEWETGPVPADVQDAQETVAWADHVVILYPLWLGGMPAVLKGFLEQLLRPAFAFPAQGTRKQKRLAGKSARIVVTMGMPAFFYRWYFRAHSLKSLERNILGFCGFKRIAHTLIGLVEDRPASRRRWLRVMDRLGHRAG